MLQDGLGSFLYGCIMQLAKYTLHNHCLFSSSATRVTTQWLKQPICFCSVYKLVIKAMRSSALLLSFDVYAIAERYNFNPKPSKQLKCSSACRYYTAQSSSKKQSTYVQWAIGKAGSGKRDGNGKQEQEWEVAQKVATGRHSQTAF